MKAFVVYPTYRVEKGSAYVYLYGRQQDGKTFLTRNKARPYFYIREADAATAKKLTPQATIENCTKRNFEDEPLSCVTLDIPKDVPPIRDALEEEGIPTYEADVRFAYRFMMDNGIQGSTEITGEPQQHAFVDNYYEEPSFKESAWVPDNLKVLSIDIETGKRGKQLYCIALAGNDNYRKTLFVTDKPVKDCECFTTEKQCLEAFTAAVRDYDPDIITGWSVIDYDLRVLQQMCQDNHVPFMLGRSDEKTKMRLESYFLRESTANIIGRVVLDGIVLLRTSFIKLEDYKLGTAAHDILGEAKVFAQETKLEQIEDSYKNNKELLAEYNLKDAELVLRILEKKKLIELTVQRSLLTGMPLDRVKASIASLDSVYLRELDKRGYAARTLTHHEKDTQITGGYVMESKPGIYDYVIVCDFKSLYPSIMRTLNIDPLSHVPGKSLKRSSADFVVAENGAAFRNEEGILPSILERLHAAREETRKTKNEVARYAIKVLMNSFFGALASPQSRFFSMEVANAITVTGQHIIKKTQGLIGEMGYEVIYGDSVTSERPIIIRTNRKVDIIPVSKLFLRNAGNTFRRGEKEVIDLRGKGIETLTANPKTGESCFKPINELIRHHTNKTIYRVNQKYGETRCTEEHSLIIRENGRYTEVKPLELYNRPLAHIDTIPPLEEINNIDLYELLEHYCATSTYKGNWKLAEVQCDDSHVWFGWTKRKSTVKMKRFISFPSKEGDALLRLMGFYLAEGSASTPETTDTRWGASLASQDISQLEQMRDDYTLLFENARCCVVRSSKGLRSLVYENSSGTQEITYEDTTHKLQMMSQMPAVFFSQLCGQRSSGKKIHSFVFHLPLREKKILLNNYVIGDGSRKHGKGYSKTYTDKHFRCTTKSLLLASGLSLLLKQLGYAMQIRYRKDKRAYTIATADHNNANLKTNIVAEPYNGYVYDLNVQDTHMFADACGQILLHNTDSIFVNLAVDNMDEAQKIGREIQQNINSFYDKWIPEQYHRESRLELAFDKVFVRFFMPMTRSGESSKKRYAGLISEDGKEHIEFTGLESVRRDWTDLAKDFQQEILDLVFHKQDVTHYVKQVLADLKAGKLDEKLVYRKALRKGLEGYTKTTPPHVKAAQQMEEITSSIIEYMQTTKGPQPVGKVTAPLDYEHYIEKQLKPIANSVLAFYDTKFDDLVKGNTQKTLFGY